MPKLTKRQKYEYRDVDPRELKLIRIGHAVWCLYQHEVRFGGGTLLEIQALLEACETVWEAKKQLRAELKAERAASFKAWRANA